MARATGCGIHWCGFRRRKNPHPPTGDDL